jgi:hypothetical protein
MSFELFLKIFILTILYLVPLYIWYRILKRRNIVVDIRLILSYFIFGSWFGIFGELFIAKLLGWTLNIAIWEYRTLPIHHGITSSYGPIMWGITAIYICFYKNYQLSAFVNKSRIMSFVLESFFLLIVELFFNFLAFGIFNEYFFYYFFPDLMHWSSFAALPFWFCGYQVIVKYGEVMYKEEKLNLIIAIMLIIITFAYQ